MLPIKDIRVIISDNKLTSSPDAGYHFLNKDINEGRGGKYIYLIYKYCANDGSDIDERITDLEVQDFEHCQVHRESGWVFLDKDLNTSVGGRYIYLSFKRGMNKNGIAALMIEDGKSSYPQHFNNWICTNVDLNKGAGGAYRYLYYQEAAEAPRKPVCGNNVPGPIASSPVPRPDCGSEITDHPVR